MGAWIKKHKKAIILAADALLVLWTVICKPLTDYMLRAGEDCEWTKYGGRCLTCGGTHFVNTFVSGDFAEAFNHHQYFFLLTLFLLISLLLLNLYLLFGFKFSLKALRLMYNVPVLILWLWGFIAFFVIRNIPLWVRVYNLVQTLI